MLVEHFLELTAKEINRPVLSPTNATLDHLTRYSWPGNVRELRNAIEFAYVKSHTGLMKPEHLPPEISNHDKRKSTKPGPLLKIKKEDILLALEKFKGNKKEAAKYLGVGRATLYRYLDLYHLK